MANTAASTVVEHYAAGYYEIAPLHVLCNITFDPDSVDDRACDVVYYQKTPYNTVINHLFPLND